MNANQQSALALAPTEQPQHAITPMDPMAMIQLAFQTAIERGEGLEVVDRILAQQRMMMEYNDKMAFQAALRRIQDELKPIVKRGENKQTHSKYAKAEDIDQLIDGLLSRERMALSFEPRISDKADEVIVVGILSLGGYSKEYPLPVPADGKGPKGEGVMSRTHATGSAITYGKRYLKDMIFNLRFTDREDDGNGASGNHNGMHPDVLAGWIAKMKACTMPDELARTYRAGYADAEKLNDKSAMFDIIKCNQAEKSRYK